MYTLLAIILPLLMPESGLYRPIGVFPVPPEPGEHVPLLITAYNWELGGVHCDNDCSYTAMGVRTSPELLGRVAACPSEEPNWLGLYLTIEGLGTFRCIDAFGASENRSLVWVSGWGWRYRVDLALPNPIEWGLVDWHGPYYISKQGD